MASRDNMFDVDIRELMEQKFYCHLCEEEGLRQKLKDVYYTKEVDSYRPGKKKYLAIAEKGCPKTRHLEAGFRYEESFYS